MNPLNLSIVVPARNESGNLEFLLSRLSGLDGVSVEVIFVEGHSIDDTWIRLQEICDRGHPKFALKCLQQPGKGKGDAVRTGFEVARGDVLAILDADLTVGPEWMAVFYRAFLGHPSGLWVGNRLGRALPKGAMRPLNWLGNHFFAYLISRLIAMPIQDALCGTKMIGATDYRILRRAMARVATLDPFGDFELILGAAALELPIYSLTVPYGARTYGSTNIRRFRDAWSLLKVLGMGRQLRALGAES